jgi:hypothetical protein
MNLCHNNLSGNLPEQLSQLTNLEELDLSTNWLFGEIPATLSSLNFLSHFIVANNNLCGPRPLGTQLQLPMRAILDFVAPHFHMSVLILLATMEILDSCFQEVTQSAGITPNKAEVISSNPPPPSCVDMLKKKKKKNNGDIGDEDNRPRIPWFQVIVVLGFITSFWGVCSPLLYSNKWRVAYFQFLNNIKNRCIILFFKITYWSI